jgi:hypothetical protein
LVQTIVLILNGQLATKPVPIGDTKSAMLSLAKRTIGEGARVRVSDSGNTRNLTLELPAEYLAALQNKRDQRRLEALRNPQLKASIRKLSSGQMESLAQAIAKALPEARQFSKWERVTRMPNSDTGYLGDVAYYPVVEGRSTNGNGGVLSMAFDLELGILTQVFIRHTQEITAFPNAQVLRLQTEKLRSKTKGKVGLAFYGYSSRNKRCEAMLRVQYSDSSFEVYDVSSLTLQFPRATVKGTSRSSPWKITSTILSLAKS